MIKFRAWAIASKVMFPPDSEDGWELRDGEINPLPNTVLMQFTGLLDKNGKEIYEGDIMWNGRYDTENGRQKVCEVVIDRKEATAGFGDYRWGGWNVSLDFPYRLQVIGNIYENSELLKI